MKIARVLQKDPIHSDGLLKRSSTRYTVHNGISSDDSGNEIVTLSIAMSQSTLLFFRRNSRQKANFSGNCLVPKNISKMSL